MPVACEKCLQVHKSGVSYNHPTETAGGAAETKDWDALITKHHLKGSQHVFSKPNPDRHRDGSRVISIRLDSVVYDHLVHLMHNSPRTHDTLGGYVRWLIETQALRKR